MNPVEFKGQNVIFAKDQPEYNPLPALKLEDGMVITCWELSDEEINQLVKSKRLFISMLTFNQPLQPIRAVTDLSELIDLTS
jgi:hypothetical protein